MDKIYQSVSKSCCNLIKPYFEIVKKKKQNKQTIIQYYGYYYEYLHTTCNQNPRKYLGNIYLSDVKSLKLT
jgi:hypothetical protein